MSGWREAAARRWLAALFATVRRLPWLVSPGKALVLPIVWWNMPRLRRRLRDNAARILGPQSTEAERSRLGREVIANFLEHIVEFGRDSDLAMQQAREAEVLGLAHYEAARSRGCGAIVVTAHLGPFESAVASLRQREECVHIVFRRDPIAAFEQLRSAQRRRLGVIEAPIDDGLPTWTALRDALAANEVVLMQGDRALPGQRAVAAPFLHGHVKVPTGPARLARLTGAPIIPIFASRQSGEVRLNIEPAIEVDATSSDEEVCTRLAAIIARYVAQHPQQWLVLEHAWIEDQQRNGRMAPGRRSPSPGSV